MALKLKKDSLNHMALGRNATPIKQKDCIDIITGQTSKDLQDAWNRWAGTTSNPRTINECAKIVAGLTNESVNTQMCLDTINPIAGYQTNWDVKLWLDASYGVYSDAGTTLATNGQSVQQWNSKAAGVSASQSTGASRPLYFASVLNSRPGIFFDGTDDSMTFSQFTTSGAYIIAYVATNSDTTNGSNILSFSGSNAWYMRANVITSEGVKFNVISNATTTTGTTQSPHFGGVSSPANGTATVYRNTSTTTVTAGSFIADGISAAVADSPAFLPHGFIHEIIVVEARSNYTNVTEDRTQLFIEIQRYLSKKWGLGIV